MTKKPQNCCVLCGSEGWLLSARGWVLCSHGRGAPGSGPVPLQPVPALHGNWLLLSEYCDWRSVVTVPVSQTQTSSVSQSASCSQSSVSVIGMGRVYSLPLTPVFTSIRVPSLHPTVIKGRVLCLVIMGGSVTGPRDVTKFPAEA